MNDSRKFTVLLALIYLTGCTDGKSMQESSVSSASEVAYEAPPVVNPGGVSGLNYTTSRIARFGITGENGMSGGGPGIWLADDEGPGGGGAESCCIGIPEVWKPDMKVTIRWEAEKVLDGKTPGVHYVAESRIPQYSKETGGMWAVFLPDDRVKVMVNDGNTYGQSNLNERPADDDPYLAQGVLDEEAEHEAAERRRKDAERTMNERRRRAKALEAEALAAKGSAAADLRRKAAKEYRLAEETEAKWAEAEALHRQVVERDAIERRCKGDASASSVDCYANSPVKSSQARADTASGGSPQSTGALR